jgi:hypothetical protein
MLWLSGRLSQYALLRDEFITKTAMQERDFEPLSNNGRPL